MSAQKKPTPIRIGCCTSPENGEAMKKAGFAYLEPAVATLVPDQDDAAFAEAMKSFEACPLPTEVFNCFLPGTLNIFGDAVNTEGLDRHVTRTFDRLRRVGAEILVFGSGGARRVPEGFPLEKVRAQYRAFLLKIAEHAERNRVTVALEPLRDKEANWLHRVSEGLEWVREIKHPRIKVLGDIFHMASMNESFDVLAAAGADLVHLHACRSDRKAPMDLSDQPLADFLKTVKKIGYRGRVSLECSWDDFPTQAPVARKVLSNALAR